MLTPKTKASDLLFRLTELVASGKEITEFEIAAFRREAKEGIKTDAFHSYMALGALSSIQWDDAELVLSHQNAIKLSDTALAHRNYAISLAHVMCYNEAFKEMRIASKKEPENLGTLHKVISYAVVSGHIGEAMNLYHELVNRSPESVGRDVNACSIKHVLDLSGVGEDEFRTGQEIVFNTLRHHRIIPSSISTKVDDDPSDPSVLVMFEVDTSSEEAQAIHDEVCARLCDELPGGGHPSVLMFSIIGNC